MFYLLQSIQGTLILTVNASQTKGESHLLIKKKKKKEESHSSHKLVRSIF